MGGKSFALGFLLALGAIITDAYANALCVASSLVIMHALLCGTSNFQIWIWYIVAGGIVGAGAAAGILASEGIAAGFLTVGGMWTSYLNLR